MFEGLTWPRAALLLSLAVIVAYSNSFGNEFHFDDSHVIQNNIYIRSLRNIPLFFTDSRTFSSIASHAGYRPLVTLTLALDYWTGRGLNPRSFHATQVLLLIATGLLLILFFNDVTADSRVSAIAAIWFCVHTVNTETMNLISARSELLSLLGLLGSFLMYLRWPRGRHLHLYLIPMLVGALAKTPSVLFGPLLLIYLIFFEHGLSVREIFSQAAAPKLKSAGRAAAPSFVAGVAMFWFLQSMERPEVALGGASWPAYVRTQPWVWLHYLRLFFWPVGLNADTDLQPFWSWRDPRLLAGSIGILILGWLIWRFSEVREKRPAVFGLTWFVVGLLPTSLVPLAEVANEHRVFLPYVGMCLAVTSLLSILLRSRRRVLAFLAAIVVLGHVVGTWKRNEVWRTEESLWADVVKKSPANGRALMNYGLTQMSRGRLTVAKEYFERAQTVAPNYSYLEVNLGVVTSALGDPSSAERHFLRALALSPDASSHYYFARFLVKQGRSPEAIPHLIEAIRVSPASMDPRTLLMNLYVASGRRSEFIVLSQETLRVDPAAPVSSFGEADYYTVFRFGHDLVRKEDFVLAAVTFRRATELQPHASDAWNNLGWTLGRLGFFEEAIPALEEAIRLRPNFDLARNNLAWTRSQLQSRR